MIKKILISFATALQNIRTRFFHTVLSILGIVIGVAALVSILSLIDGMEQYAQEQITKTTSLKAILIQPNLYKSVNGVDVRKQTYSYLDYHSFTKLRSALPAPATAYLYLRMTGEVLVKATQRSVGTVVMGTSLPLPPGPKLLYGNAFTEADLQNRRSVVVINQPLAKQLAGHRPTQAALRQQLVYKGHVLTVIGISGEAEAKTGQLIMPVTLFSDTVLRANAPMCVIEAGRIEDVPVLKMQVERWADRQHENEISRFHNRHQ